MRFIIKNFGPIEDADITLRRLNIFIGKNSSGKSVLAYLIWSLLSVEPDWNKLRALVDDLLPISLIREIDKKPDNADEINKELSERIREFIIKVYENFGEIWGRNLENLLKDVFLVDSLDKLIRFGCDEADIIISNDRGDKKIYIKIDKSGLSSHVDDAVLEDLRENLVINVVTVEHPILTLGYHKNSENLTYSRYITDNYEAVVVIPIIFMWLFDDYTPYSQTFIAPDGRSGLIRSIEAYKYALISGRVTVNEVDRIFMRDLESLYPRIKNEEISNLAKFIENKLNIEYQLRREQPRYELRIGEIEIPLQRAPSGYRELAPIVYAMRFALDKDYVVFVEEPEAHLHPDAQVIVTRALAGLSEYCYVVATTHSITILDEISNLLKLSGLDKNTKRKLGYEEWEGLGPENIGVFLFSDGKVEELEVYEDGIEQSELDRVIIEIANLHAKVDEEYEYFKRMHTHK